MMGLSSLVRQWKSAILIVCVALLFSLGIAIQPAAAHRPHDVVTQVELSPDYSQDQTVLIVVRGNLYRSTDGGSSWQRIVQGLRTSQILTDLELSRQSNGSAFLGTNGDGIYRSTDQGISWQRLSNGLEDLAIQKLAISPAASDVVLASSLSGRLYHTQDAGNTWQEVATSAEAIEAIGFSSDGQTAIAVTPQQVLISRDRGQSWQLLNRQKTGLPLESPVVAMQAVRKGSSEQILVATRTKGIFQTSDQGMTWRQFSGPIDNEQVEDLVVFKTTNADPQIVLSTAETGLFSWDSQQWQPKTQGLQTDPQADEMKQPNFTDLAMTADGQITFLTGFDGVFKSADQGQQWQALETLARGTIVALAVSTNPDNTTTIAAVDYVGDIRISYDSGKTWTIAEEGLQTPWFTRNFNPIQPNKDPRRYFDVAFSPDYNHDETIWATILYTKLAKTRNAGKSWIITSLPKEQRGLAVAASPNFAADKTIYVVPQSGAIYQSLNGGKRFQKISEVPKLQGNFGSSIAISPGFASDRTLYVTGGEGIYQSVNGGRDWQAITKATPLAEAGQMQIVISPNFAQDQTLFVSTSNQGLFQSQDGGKTWNQQKNWPDLGDELPYFEAIAISPNYAVDQTLLVSVRGVGLYKSEDAGQSFAKITDASVPLSRVFNVPSSGKPLIFSPNYANDQTIYGFGSAASEIFQSTDGGTNWQSLKLPYAPYQTNTALPTFSKLRMLLSFKQGTILKLLALLIVAVLGYGLVSCIDLLKPPATTRVWQALIIAVLALAIFFRVVNVDQKVYSADEVRSILRLSGYTSNELRDTRFNGDTITAQEIRERYQVPNPDKNLQDAVKALAGNPEHPPLYHLLTRFWMQVFNEPVASRTISIVLSLAALPCIYWLCSELFNSSLIAWITVLLAAVSPFNIMSAQNATQYSLWLLILSLSSALFLRALRQETKRDWAIYGVSVALGFYTHLFFVIAVITHGLYLLLVRGWRSIKVWFSYILATLLGMLLFSPWLITILTRLDQIEENTRYYRNFDNNNLQLMAKTLMTNMGNAFLDFHNQNRLESYFDLAFILFVIYAAYFLIRNSSKKEWLFPILLAITTLLAHWTPDLISSSARSLQMRYYLPYFLSIQLIIAYLLAGYIQLMPFKRWQQRLGRLGLLGLVSAGVISGIFISQINDWGIDDQRGTASSRNLQVAPVLNQSSQPLVISDATHSFILALSHLVKDNVSFKLFKPEDSAAWESVVDLQSLSQKYSDIYLYNPDQKLIDFVDQQDAFDANQVPNTNNYLYQVVPQENEDDSKLNSSLLDEA